MQKKKSRKNTSSLQVAVLLLQKFKKLFNKVWSLQDILFRICQAIQIQWNIFPAFFLSSFPETFFFLVESFDTWDIMFAIYFLYLNFDEMLKQ